MYTDIYTASVNIPMYSTIFVISLVLFLVSAVLLIVFSFKPDSNLLWILGMGLFIFAVILCGENLVSCFIAILVSIILLLVFSRKNDMIYCFSMAFILVGAVISIMTDYIWLIIAFIPSALLICLHILIVGTPSKDTGEIPLDQPDSGSVTQTKAPELSNYSAVNGAGNGAERNN